MSNARVTPSDVQHAVNALRATGERPTTRAVRGLIGYGSMGTIARILREIGANEAPPEADAGPLPPLPEALHRAMAHAIETAGVQREAVLMLRVDELEKRNVTLTNTVTALSTTADFLARQVTEAQRVADALRLQVADAEARVEAERKRADEAERRAAEDAEDTKEALRAQRQRHTDEYLDVEARAEEAEARAGNERQRADDAETRAYTLEREIVTLRARLAELEAAKPAPATKRTAPKKATARKTATKAKAKDKAPAPSVEAGAEQPQS